MQGDGPSPSVPATVGQRKLLALLFSPYSSIVSRALQSNKGQDRRGFQPSCRRSILFSSRPPWKSIANTQRASLHVKLIDVDILRVFSIPQSTRKSALLSAAKKAKLRNNPSRVRFAEGVVINGTALPLVGFIYVFALDANEARKPLLRTVRSPSQMGCFCDSSTPLSPFDSRLLCRTRVVCNIIRQRSSA